MNDHEALIKDGIFKLSKPYKYGDAPERTELDFPLAAMTGQHIRKAQATYEMVEGRTLEGIAELNKIYLGHIAAAVLKVNPDFVFDLPVGDFTGLTMAVQRFLIGA